MASKAETIACCIAQALDRSDWQAVEVGIVEAAKLARSQLAVLCRGNKSSCSELVTRWFTKGHHIRHHVGDDNLLLDALYLLLPCYEGPGLTLYRGESFSRWQHGAYGSAWSTKIDVARMFARGLNAMYPRGGVLLSTDAPANAIITGPSAHSVWLQEYEYVVDRRKLREVTLLACFPQAC
jgi:hypothetical protein